MRARLKELLPKAEAQSTDTVSTRVRLPHFIECRADAASVLAALHLVIVGVGSIGWNIGEKAARLGVGTLSFIDPGRLKPSSTFTHPVSRSEASRRLYKAKEVARRCRAINPSVRCFYANCRLDELDDLRFLQQTDLVILASDNLAAEVTTGRACRNFSKPLLHCAVHGASLVTQARLFGNRDGNSPCICCSFSEDEKQQLNQSVKYSCTGSNVTVSAPPTMSAAFLCSLAGDLGLMIVLRNALSLGESESLVDRQLDFHGYTQRIVTTRLRKSPTCVCDHSHWLIRPQSEPVCDQTLTGLGQIAVASTGSGSEQISFGIRGMAFVQMGICGCGRLHPVQRFARSRQKLGTCNYCKGPVLPHPFFSQQMIPLVAVKADLNIPIKKLGAAQSRHVLVRVGQKCVFLYDPLST